MSGKGRRRNRHTASAHDIIRRLAWLLVVCAIAVPSAGQADPQRSGSPQPAGGQAQPQAAPAPAPEPNTSQTVQVSLLVVLRQGRQFGDSAVSELQAALGRAGCKGDLEPEVLASEATPGCKGGLQAGARGQGLPGNSTGDGGPCRRISVEALVVTPDPEGCLERMRAANRTGTFLNDPARAIFEAVTVEAASVLRHDSATTSVEEIREEGGDCPLGDTGEGMLGLYEGLGCDTCDCISDPSGLSCASVAGRICASPVPRNSCATLRDGFLSGVEEDVIVAGDAIVDRCPQLDRSTDICRCLQYPESKQCTAALFRGCGIHPSLCIDKIEVLNFDSPLAKERVLRTIAEACGEGDRLLVLSVVISGPSYVSFMGSIGERFRHAVASLAGVDFHQVTVLSRQEEGQGLRVSFAVYTQDPVGAEQRITDADATGQFLALLEESPIQGQVSAPAAADLQPPPTFSSVRAWVVLLGILGAILVVTLTVAAVRHNRAYVMRHSGAIILASGGSGGDEVSGGSSEQHSSGGWAARRKDGMEEGGLEDGKELTTIGSYSPGAMGTQSSNNLSWLASTPCGRPALELSTLNRSGSEKKRQFRTVHMTAPMISYSSGESDPDSRPPQSGSHGGRDGHGDGGVSFTVNPVSTSEPFFPPLGDNGWFNAVDADGPKHPSDLAASPLKLLTTSAEFFSADEQEMASPASGLREEPSLAEPLAISVHCPPSPIRRTQSRRSGVRTPGSPRDAGSPMLSSSDWEFDVTEDDEGRGVSQFQYQGLQLAQDVATFSRQYVNYLYDEPVTSRSQATNRSFHSETAAREAA